MIGLLVTVLLLNSCSGSWGAPTPQNQNVTMLSNVLNALAISCKNNFLASQLINKMSDCHVPAYPYKEKQLECLFFYDINKRMCQAVQESKLEINQNYTAVINAEKDVSQLCEAAKQWTFSDIDALYKKTVEKVFQNPVLCTKICTGDITDNILSVDSSYFCKYYKWGSEMLNPVDNNITTPKIKALENVADQPSGVEADLKVDQKVLEKETGPGVESIVTNMKSTSDAVLVKEDVNTGTADKTNPSSESVKTIEQSATGKDVMESVKPQSDEKTEPQAVLPPIDTPAGSSEGQEPILKETTNSNKIDANTKNATLLTDVVKESPVKSLVPQIVKSSDTVDPEEYPASDVDPDSIGDEFDGEDPSMPNLETKPDKTSIKNHISSEAVYNSDISTKELYANVIPEGFGDDDDHFFPFFLTTIIVIIMLYILYHNKNKVSKLFLGLVVEGRQPGRRRNSRGHAYRRLDTLEQAMSANTAAPPSKIIY